MKCSLSCYVWQKNIRVARWGHPCFAKNQCRLRSRGLPDQTSQNIEALSHSNKKRDQLEPGSNSVRHRLFIMPNHLRATVPFCMGWNGKFIWSLGFPSCWSTLVGKWYIPRCNEENTTNYGTTNTDGNPQDSGPTGRLYNSATSPATAWGAGASNALFPKLITRLFSARG